MATSVIIQFFLQHFTLWICTDFFRYLSVCISPQIFFLVTQCEFPLIQWKSLGKDCRGGKLQIDLVSNHILLFHLYSFIKFYFNLFKKALISCFIQTDTCSHVLLAKSTTTWRVQQWNNRMTNLMFNFLLKRQVFLQCYFLIVESPCRYWSYTTLILWWEYASRLMTRKY